MMWLLYLRYYLRYYLQSFGPTFLLKTIGIPTQESRLTLSDLNNDVLLNICDHFAEPAQSWNGTTRVPLPTPLKNLSCVNRRLRTLLRTKVMKSIDLIEPRTPGNQKNPNGWILAKEIIDGISCDTSLVEAVRNLRLDLYGHVFENNYAVAKELAHITAFLGSLPNLQLLRLKIPRAYMFAFEDSVKADAQALQSTFNNLTTLYIRYRMAFLLDYCPHLKRLALYDTSHDGIHPYKVNVPPDIPMYSQITHVEVKASWTPSVVTYLAAAFPNLSYIAILGYKGEPSLAELLIELGKGFKKLRVLVLPGVGDLRLGFGDAICGTPFTGPNGKEAIRRHMKRKMDAQDRAARLAFGACVGLKECWLGEANVARILDKERGRVVLGRGDSEVGSRKGDMRPYPESEPESHNDGHDVIMVEDDDYESDGYESDDYEYDSDEREVPETSDNASEENGSGDSDNEDDDYEYDSDERVVLESSDDDSEEDGSSDIDNEAYEELLNKAKDMAWEWSRAGSWDFVEREGRLLYVL